jgi:ABC-type molybdate transport system substrate-binding protein
MKPNRIFILGVVLLACLGCHNPQRLTVYADPWLAEFAETSLAEFQVSHPEVEVVLKERSSEVIVQHIHFGQPVDVFLCFDEAGIQQPDFRAKIETSIPLADTRIVRVMGTGKPIQRQLKTEGCTMVEASDRPTRRLAERHFPGFFVSDSCRIVANFQSQAQDYLLRGWTIQGFVPQHFARQNGAMFSIRAQSPLITKAFSALRLKNAGNPTVADQYMKFLTEEKTKKMLGDLNFLP